MSICRPKLPSDTPPYPAFPGQSAPPKLQLYAVPHSTESTAPCFPAPNTPAWPAKVRGIRPKDWQTDSGDRLTVNLPLSDRLGVSTASTALELGWGDGTAANRP
jgi:hypothetical protein